MATQQKQIPGQRQRADGTFTWATEEHDAKWYWPEGTRVRVERHPELGVGTVTKQNSTTVWAEFEGAYRGCQRFKVQKPALIRVEEELPRIAGWSDLCEAMGTRCTHVNAKGVRCDNGVEQGDRCKDHRPLFKRSAASIATQIDRERRERKAARCTNSPRCAARGCADCERSYGPRR